MMDQIADLLVKLITAVDLRRASLLPGIVVIAFFSGCIVLALYGFGIFVPFLPAFLAIFLLWGGFWLISRHASASSKPNDSPTQEIAAPTAIPQVEIAAADPLQVREQKQVASGVEINAKSAELNGNSQQSTASPKGLFKAVDRFRWVLLTTTIAVNGFFIAVSFLAANFPGSYFLSLYTLSCACLGPALMLMLIPLAFMIIPKGRIRRFALVAFIANITSVVIILAIPGFANFNSRDADYNQVVSLAETGQLQPDSSGKAVLPAKYNGLSMDGYVLISGRGSAMEVEFDHFWGLGVDRRIHTSDAHIPYKWYAPKCYPEPGYPNWYDC